MNKREVIDLAHCTTNRDEMYRMAALKKLPFGQPLSTDPKVIRNVFYAALELHKNGHFRDETPEQREDLLHYAARTMAVYLPVLPERPEDLMSMMEDVFFPGLQKGIPNLSEGEVYYLVQQVFPVYYQLYHWDLCGRPYYFIDPVLSVMLKQTSVSKVPIEYLRLPYPSICIQPLGDIRFNNTVLLPEPGEELTIGISQHPRVSEGLLIHLVLLGKNLEGKRGIHHRNNWIMNLPAGEETTLGQKIDDAVGYMSGHQDRHGDTNLVSAEDIRGWLNYCFAVLLYLTTPNADSILIQDSEVYRAWVESMKQMKNRKKRVHRERECAKHIGDKRFYVGRTLRIIDRHEPTEEESSSPKGSHASPRMHWRQGHFHTYKVGEGRQDKKVNWVAPVLVNKNMVDAGDTKTRYKAI